MKYFGKYHGPHLAELVQVLYDHGNVLFASPLLGLLHVHGFLQTKCYDAR